MLGNRSSVTDPESKAGQALLNVSQAIAAQVSIAAFEPKESLPEPQ